MINVLYIWLVLLVPQEDCKKEVANAYQQLKLLNSTPEGFRIQYKVTTTNWEDVAQSEETTIIKNGPRVKVSTTMVDIYQDAEAMVAINKSSKSVFIIHPVQQSVRMDQFKVFATVFDSLFLHFKVLSCETVREENGNTGNLRKITFGLDEKARTVGGMTSITYWLHENLASVKRIQIDYKPKTVVKRIDFMLLDLKLDYRTDPFDKSAISYALDNNGRLLNSLKDFQLIDRRKVEKNKLN